MSDRGPDNEHAWPSVRDVRDGLIQPPATERLPMRSRQADFTCGADVDEDTVQLAATLSFGWPSAAAGLGVLVTGLLRERGARLSRATPLDDDPWR